jgi:hypothetical protein
MIVGLDLDISGCYMQRSVMLMAMLRVHYQASKFDFLASLNMPRTIASINFNQ